MNVLGKFESAMQAIVEGSFGRVFRSRLHPVEVSKRLERAMDQGLTISLGRKTAPNVYDVFMSDRDYAQFEANARTFITQFQEDLIAVARTRGYILTTRPIVILHPEERMVTGELRVDARLAEPQAVPAGIGAPAELGAIEETRELSPAEADQLKQQMAQAQAAREVAPQAWLVLRRPGGGGPVYRLDKSVIHIGRHISNDIVVNDKRVSRYHAEIRLEGDQFFLYDLGSLNGLGVNGVIMRGPAPLRNNDLIAVGNHDFIFQRR
jgi:FhaA, N-terminal domain/FHA domain